MSYSVRLIRAPITPSFPPLHIPQARVSPLCCNIVNVISLFVLFLSLLPSFLSPISPSFIILSLPPVYLHHSLPTPVTHLPFLYYPNVHSPHLIFFRSHQHNTRFVSTSSSHSHSKSSPIHLLPCTLPTQIPSI